MTRQNLLRSRLTAALSIMAVLAIALFGVRPVPAGAAPTQGHFVFVTDAGFDPPIVSNVNVGDAVIFILRETDYEHTVTFRDDSICPGERGAVPCWPELRFDTDTANCKTEFGTPKHWRCLEVLEPGATVQYYDAKHEAYTGEIRVLGQPTTTTGPAVTTTTRPPTTTTTAGPTTTTLPQSTTSTAPTQIRPLVIPDPTTSTTAPAAIPVVVTTGGTAPASAAKQDKDKGNGKGAKSKAAEAETPATVAPAPSDAVPLDIVFDPAALTPAPVVVPDTPGVPTTDDVNIESAAIANLLEEEEEPADHRLWLLALGGLAFVLLAGGTVRWFHRASNYYPA